MEMSNLGKRQGKRHDGVTRSLMLAFATVFLLTSCGAPTPPSGIRLYQALLKDTGYQLGDDTSSGDDAGTGKCAAEGRYGDPEMGPVVLLICVGELAESGAGRVKYRVNFTPPEAGHRIWKIAATFPDKRLQDIDFIKDFNKNYGIPRKVTNPLMLTWQLEEAYLEVREDQYGVHLQLWDRSLR